MILDRHSHIRISPFWFSRHPTLAGRALAPVLPFGRWPRFCRSGASPRSAVRSRPRFSHLDGTGASAHTANFGILSLQYQPLNDDDLVEFVQLQKTLSISASSNVAFSELLCDLAVCVVSYKLNPFPTTSTTR